MNRFVLAALPIVGLMGTATLPALAETLPTAPMPRTRIEQQLQKSQRGPWLTQPSAPMMSRELAQMSQRPIESSQFSQSPISDRSPKTRIEQQLQNSQHGPWQQ